MGLKNSTQCFQHLLNHVLDGMDNVYCYLDDILFWDQDEQTLKQIITELYRRLDQAGFTISQKKCQFGCRTITFLGFQVSATGIEPILKRSIPKRLEAIASFPAPNYEYNKPKGENLLALSLFRA